MAIKIDYVARETATNLTRNVTLTLESDTPSEGSVSPSTLTFTTANWNLAQTVTVSGVDDALDDGDVAYSIVTAPATSADVIYNNVNAADVAVINTDNDATSDLAVTKTDGVAAVTAGGSTTYTVVVSNAGPGAVVGATVTDTAPANVTFGTWACVASAGSTCPASGTGNIAATVDLVAGGTAVFTVPATISTVASGTVTNTATVSAPPPSTCAGSRSSTPPPSTP